MLGGFDDVRATAAAGEAAGYAGLWTGETMHDPFLQIVQAAAVTERVTLGTSIAIAFGRTPMTLATTSYDLARYSQGRFVLGLGSQVKPHIERRFSMPWSHPAPRMREFVSALRAIWTCWQDGTKLDFRGDFYTHTLMTPFFSPGPNAFGNPPIHLAGVGPRMTAVAGEVADGFMAHAFSTERYLHEVTLPALHQGFEKAGRDGSGFEFSATALIATGNTEEEFEESIRDVRRQVAFYGSTPAYHPVLELHGWGDLARELNTLSKRGEWEAMGYAVDDEVLHTIAIVAEPAEVGPALERRFGGVAQRIPLYAPRGSQTDRWGPALAHLQALP